MYNIVSPTSGNPVVVENNDQEFDRVLDLARDMFNPRSEVEFYNAVYLEWLGNLIAQTGIPLDKIAYQ